MASVIESPSPSSILPLLCRHHNCKLPLVSCSQRLELSPVPNTSTQPSLARSSLVLRLLQPPLPSLHDSLQRPTITFNHETPVIMGKALCVLHIQRCSTSGASVSALVASIDNAKLLVRSGPRRFWSAWLLTCEEPHNCVKICIRFGSVSNGPDLCAH